MAIYCEKCKLIYRRLYDNCPKCGDRLTEDVRSEEDLTDEGFRVYGANRSSASITIAAPKRSTEPVHIDSESTLREIRSMFSSSRESAPANSPQSIQNEASSSADTMDTNASGADTAENNAPPSSGVNFFENPDDDSFRIHQNTPPLSPEPEQASDSTLVDDTPANPSRRFATRRRRERVNVPWGMIVRVLLIIAVVYGVIAVWNARDLIVRGILDFFISLLPLLLIVGIMIYLIRVLFRGR